MKTKPLSPFLAGLYGKIKALPKGLYVCFGLLLALCITGAIATGQYENAEDTRTLQHWTHDYVSAFYDLAVAEGEILQEFTAVDAQLTEFILLFENYAPTDTGTISVKLENKRGENLYMWEVPVTALTGQMFCLNAKVEQPLQKGKSHFIRIGLTEGESDITVRALLKTDYKAEELHPSVKTLTVDGQMQDVCLYFSQKYQASVSYAKIWNSALAVTVLLLLVLVWCKGTALRILWEGLNVLFLLLISYVGTELLSGHIYTIESRYALYHCLIVLIGYLVLRTVSGRIAFYGVAVLTLLAGVTNFYVLQFKGAEFLLTDLSAFSTAMSVAGNYEFTVPPVLFTVLILYACVILLQAAVDGNFASAYKKPGLVQRGVLPVLALVAVLLVGQSVKTATFDYFVLSSNFSKYGWWYSNVCILKNSSMKKPGDYSEKTVEKILSEVEAPEKQGTTPQNLIVIMNEAWSDLRLLGQLDVSGDYMPFVRSLEENTVKGNVHVATFGGGTCYTEYEFLTGNALRFMPSGLSPYAQSGALADEPGMASILKDQGYRTVAMHPYGPKNWNRDQVYPAMGFEEFISIDDYEGGEYIRNYISDKSDYDKIIEYYEAHRGEKLFVFNVTMQNHGGYDINNGKLDTGITVNNIDCNEADTYLSLMQETDKAFAYLLSYFEQVEEPTMIVMFGDHLPALPESFYTALYGKEASQRSALEENARFITPYVIWTNYSSDFEEIPDISINYLGSLVLEYAGVQLPRYNQFLLQQRKKIPVLGLRGIYNEEGQFVPYESVAEELLQDYKILQYMRIEDRQSELYNIFSLEE